MTTEDVASRLIQLCRKGEFILAEEELYWQNAIHIEANGEKFEGLNTLIIKEKLFLENILDKPSVTVSEPLIAGDFFTIAMHIEFTHKESGSRIIDEIIIYKVINGKIVFVACYF
jgi:hypothetical protein